MQAIHNVAEHIDAIMYAVEQKRFLGEQWLVMVIPDHGGHNLSHGNQEWTDKEIFAVFQDPADPRLLYPFRWHKLFLVILRYCCEQELRAVQGQTTIVPTALEYLLGPAAYRSQVLPNHVFYGLPIDTAPLKLLYMK